MPGFLDELAVALTGDASGLIATFTKAGEQAGQIANSIGSNISNRVASGVIKAQIALAALTRAFELAKEVTVEMVSKSMENIDAQAKLADRLGISTQAMAGLTLQARMMGISADEVARGMTFMERSLADAVDPTSKQARSLRELGISLRDLEGLSPDQQFARLADALNNVRDKAERTRVTMEIFGRGGAQLNNIIAQGSEGMAKSAEEAQKLGLAINRVDAAKVEQANEAFIHMHAAIEGAFNIIAVSLAPKLQAIVDAMVDLIENTDGWKDAFAEAGDFIVSAAGAIADGIRRIIITVDAVKVAIGYWSIAFNTVMGFITSGVLYIASFFQNLGRIFHSVGTVLIDEFKVAWLAVKESASSAVAWIEVRFSEMLLKIADSTQRLSTSMANAMRDAAFAIGRDASKGAETITKEYSEAVDETKQDAADLKEHIANVFDVSGLQYANPFPQWAEEAKAQTADWKADLDRALGTPPPSQAITEFFRKADAAEQQSASHTAQIHAASNATYVTAEEQKTKTISQMADDYDASETQREMQVQAKNLAIWRSGYMGKLQIASQILSQVSTLMQSHSKKQFEIGKAAAIATTTINTAEAAMEAYSAMASIPYVGPVLGALAAAAAIAAGAVQIQNIKSTQFNGGGSAGSAPAAPSGALAAAANGAGGGPSGSAQSVNIHLSGQSFSQGDVRQLIENINGALSDGAKLNVA